MYHPFRAAFAELCKQAARWTWEPRRADVKAPESWIEMADGSGGLFYYCFVTKAREFGMPSLSLQTTLGLPLGLTANAQAERMQHRFTKRLATGVRGWLKVLQLLDRLNPLAAPVFLRLAKRQHSGQEKKW